MTEYQKEDDYTLLVTNDVPGAGGTLCRYFNFAAESVTTIYNAKSEMTKSMKAGSYDGGVSVAVSTALTSQMTVQKFSDFDSDREIELMREKLVEKGGTPPSEDMGKSRKVPRPAATLGKTG
ncbi:MAG: hypothetical protein GC185_13565 [Alphaproteobacteria bacterium]|nr:hypothetical protein [Alphaproteobacteria bacterium]